MPNTTDSAGERLKHAPIQTSNIQTVATRWANYVIISGYVNGVHDATIRVNEASQPEWRDDFIQLTGWTKH